MTAIQRPAGSDTFLYDLAGNMTSRLEGGLSWSQSFDSQSRLAVLGNGADTWTFTYDGDGNRVRQANPDGTRTLFPFGGLYQVTLAADGSTQSVIRYYAVAGQRLALRDASGLHFLLTDHLGSVVAVLNGSGVLESEQRYLPFGDGRYASGIGQTDFGYTRQRLLAAAGVYDYNARWYSPAISRFLSADTIVPGAGEPQGLNRYAYVAGNPLRFTDPSGQRRAECGPFGADCGGSSSRLIHEHLSLGSDPGPQPDLSVTDSWTEIETSEPTYLSDSNAPGVPIELTDYRSPGCPQPNHLIDLPGVWKPSPCQRLDPVGKVLIVSFGMVVVSEMLEVGAASLEAGPVGVLPAVIILAAGIWVGSSVWNIAQTPTRPHSTLEGG